MCDAIVLGIAGLAMSGVGMAAGQAQQQQQARARRAALNAQARVADYNARIQDRAAKLAVADARAESVKPHLRGEAMVGKQRSALAAGGWDVNDAGGTAGLLQFQTRDAVALDRQTIEANGREKAFHHQVAAWEARTDATLLRNESGGVGGGGFGTAAGALSKGLGKAAGFWEKWGGGFGSGDAAAGGGVSGSLGGAFGTGSHPGER